MISKVNHRAQGSAGITEAVVLPQFFLDAGGLFRTEAKIIASGQVLEENSILGRITATGKLVLCDPAAANGSQAPYAIILQPLDTSATGHNDDVEVKVVTMSDREINFNALVAHADWAGNESDLKEGLHQAGIFVGTPFYSAL